MYAELIQKKCSVCKLYKDRAEFSARKASPDGLAYKCKPCDAIAGKIYVATNRDQVRAQRKQFRQENKARLSVKKNRAKCPPEQFHQMFTEQNGCCAICGLHQNNMRRRIAIDHNHITGRIRGLLCDNCNRCLGLLKDSQAILLGAIEYLNKYEK